MAFKNPLQQSEALVKEAQPDDYQWPTAPTNKGPGQPIPISQTTKSVNMVQPGATFPQQPKAPTQAQAPQNVNPNGMRLDLMPTYMKKVNQEARKNKLREFFKNLFRR